MRNIVFPREDVKKYFDSYFRVHLARFFLSPEDFISLHHNRDSFYFKGNNINTPILNVDRRRNYHTSVNGIYGHNPLSSERSYCYFTQDGSVKYQEGYNPEYDAIYNEYYLWIDDLTKYNFIFVAFLCTHAIAQESWMDIDRIEQRGSLVTNLGCGLMDLPKFSITDPVHILKAADIILYGAENSTLLRALETVAPFYVKRLKQYMHEKNHPLTAHLLEFKYIFNQKISVFIQRLK